MKVLVTGGTGFVGRELVRQLRAAGHTPRVLARGTAGSAAVPGVELVRGSVLEPAGLPAAFAGMDAIIHLVGIISEHGAQTFERVHPTGTANVLAATQAAGVRRFLHMSALGTRPDAVARYHQSKWAAEELVRRSGLAWTIFRPSLVYGPGDGFINLFARLARWSPVLPVMGPGTNQLQPVTVEDVARCFVDALTHAASVSQTYDVCGRERFTFREVLAAILAATGRRRLTVSVPLPLARLQAGLLERVYPALFDAPPPLNRDQLLMLQEDNLGDPEPACHAFGFEPVRFREGLGRFLAARR